jgi:type IV pilus assembly protein PilE
MRTMEKPSAARPVPQAGFTLIELMITVAVVAILATFAVASYSSQVLKSRRTEAKTALLDLAGREERFMSTRGTYTTVPSELGYPGTAWPQALASGYFNIAVFTAAATNTRPATFTLTASASGPQAKDTNCSTLTVDSLGQQKSQNSASGDTTNTAKCWN